MASRTDRRKAEAAISGRSAPNAKTQVKEYKESLILDAAAKLFAEKGFQRTTIDDLGAALGVTKPFIYTYFESKHRILERLFDRVYHEVYERVTAPEAGEPSDPLGRFKYFMSWYLRVNLEQRQFSANLLEEEKNLSPEKIEEIRHMQRTFDDLLAKLVQDGVAAGVFHVDEPKLASLALSGMVRWTHRWYSPAGRLTLDELIAQLVEIALRVVGWCPLDSVEGAQAVATRRVVKA